MLTLVLASGCAEQHRAGLAVRINYTDLTATDPVDPDAALEAELASFAALLKQSPVDALPGQLDLSDLINHDTDTDNDSEGPR